MRSALARLCFKLRRRKDEEIQFAPWHSGIKGDGTAPQLNGARYFSLEELREYTHNFSESYKIGAGSYGEVYKGCCSNGVIVAVKRYGSFRSTKQFQIEIEVLSRVHHKNIVSLIGFCTDQGEQILVYEYMSNGSLRDYLAGKCGVYLNWEKRLQIALDSARALAYLHELANLRIIHRDVKPGNIMLDENLNAKVANFGLSKLVSEKEKGHVSSQGRGIIARVESEKGHVSSQGRGIIERVESEPVAATVAYLDPEYFHTQILSEKSDVYSFGLVMLDLITARRPIIFGPDGNTSLVEEVKRAIDENDQEYYGLRDLIDPEIVNQVTSVGVIKFVQLALQCLKYFGSYRPSMYEIMKEIDFILQHVRSE
ncbi:hypothetical protein LUZ61_008556 [Rhynchospora tenuis]|uniref:non-specific serine/threonine protein kinase n=1 Tax=Rhynchospora tenuis TaxID=198213 RepID=A0AAD5ZVM9_9POAL|nr:hypothetical protein LUZ61_008556 [Rhynchospora tenuis]